MDNVHLTICCFTYNHENYIKNTLDSFLSQETKYSYEILIHDDASTDNTQAIIRDYLDKYPDKIKAVLQEVNQYSQGISPELLLLKKAQGKYISLCEGDDCFINDHKIEMQLDYLESNPDCTFCFTNAIIENQVNMEQRQFIPYSEADKQFYQPGNKKVTLDNCHEMSFIFTASFVFPIANIQKMPQSYLEYCPTGDLKLRLYCVSLGYGYFIDEATTLYRENVPGSMMSKWRKEDTNSKKAIARQKLIIKMINNVDEFTNYQHTKGLNKIKDLQVKPMLFNSSSLLALRDEDCLRCFKDLSLYEKSKVIAKTMVFNKLKNRSLK